MKKRRFAALLALCMAASLGAQEATDGSALLDVGEYSKLFVNSRGRITSEYISPVSDDDYDRFCTLGGDTTEIDTQLEISLLSYYSQPVLNIRPAAANAILPKNNPRLSDLKLGAAVYQEMQVLRFLGNTDAVGRHEGILQFITGRGNVSRAEIEAFLRQGILALIDENLNKTYVSSKNYYDMEVIYLPETKGFRLTYTRDQNGVPKEITAKDLAELQRKMTNSREFSAEDINQTVNDRALKIPAYVYSEWLRRGISQYNGVDLIKEAIIRFYTEPTQSNYNVLLGISAGYWKNGAIVYQTFESNADKRFSSILRTLSPELDKKIGSTIANSNPAELATLARALEGSKYGILLTPYTTTGR